MDIENQFHAAPSEDGSLESDHDVPDVVQNISYVGQIGNTVTTYSTSLVNTVPAYQRTIHAESQVTIHHMI